MRSVPKPNSVARRSSPVAQSALINGAVGQVQLARSCRAGSARQFIECLFMGFSRPGAAQPFPVASGGSSLTAQPSALHRALIGCEAQRDHGIRPTGVVQVQQPLCLTRPILWTRQPPDRPMDRPLGCARAGCLVCGQFGANNVYRGAQLRKQCFLSVRLELPAAMRWHCSVAAE